MFLRECFGIAIGVIFKAALGGRESTACVMKSNLKKHNRKDLTFSSEWAFKLYEIISYMKYIPVTKGDSLSCPLCSLPET